MGKESVVATRDSFISAIRRTINIIMRARGDFKLFMLLPDQELDTFTAIASATWLDRLTPKEGITMLVQYVFSEMTTAELALLSRITVVNTHDPYVIEMTTAGLKVNQSTVTLNDCIFGSVKIPYAVIFECM